MWGEGVQVGMGGAVGGGVASVSEWGDAGGHKLIAPCPGRALVARLCAGGWGIRRNTQAA